VAAPASPLTQLNSPAHLPGAKSPRPAPDGSDRYQDRYRLHVVATNIADVVTSIGGLIFDRAMAGWDVTVAIDGDSRGAIDDRPIRILGARVATPVAEPDCAGSAFRPQVLAVASDVFVKNESVRRLVLAARKGNTTNVLLWGRRHPPNLNYRFVPVRHRPSAAAHVFKSHALATRGASAGEPTEEGLYSMA
jgi:hypothetical protein